jgi:cytochrome b involved in lipid metabolism
MKKTIIVIQVIFLSTLIWYFFIYNSKNRNIKSQNNNTHSIYLYNKKLIFKGKITALYKSENHNVPYIVVQNKEYNIDDFLFSKVKKDDSIVKNKNSDYYIIYRDFKFFDSINLKDCYEFTTLHIPRSPQPHN